MQHNPDEIFGKRSIWYSHCAQISAWALVCAQLRMAAMVGVGWVEGVHLRFI